MKKNRLVYDLACFLTKKKMHWRKKNVFKSNKSVFLRTKINFLNAKNNYIEVSKSILKKCRFHIAGSNNRIIIHENCHFSGCEFYIEDDGNLIEIGSNTIFAGSCQLACCEGTKIIVGKNCLFSSNISFRTTDSHAILDKNGKRINKAKDILLEDNVWCGAGCLLLKGTNIPSNCVIGANSIVAKKLESANSVYAGNEIRLIKTDITWNLNRTEK